MAAQCENERPSCNQVLGELLREGLWSPPEEQRLELVVAGLHAQRGAAEAALRDREREVELLRHLLNEHGIAHDHINIVGAVGPSPSFIDKSCLKKE